MKVIHIIHRLKELFTLKRSRKVTNSTLKHSRFSAETLPHSIYACIYQYKKPVVNNKKLLIVGIKKIKNLSIFLKTYFVILFNLKEQQTMVSLAKIKSSKLVTFLKKSKFALSTFLIAAMSQKSFAEDIFKTPMQNVFDSFNGTGVLLLILAEIIGAYAYWHKSRDLKGTVTGLAFVLVLTGFASTKLVTK